MALLHPEPYKWKATRGNWDAQSKELEELAARTGNLPDGEILGGLIKFSVADSYAYYLVHAKDPLTLQHVDYGDGYAIHPAFVRGLLEEDVLELVEHEKRWARALAETQRRRAAGEIPSGGRWNSR